VTTKRASDFDRITDSRNVVQEGRNLAFRKTLDDDFIEPNSSGPDATE
jgi:hypothetical protein